MYSETVLGYAAWFDVSIDLHLCEPTTGSFSRLQELFGTRYDVHLNRKALSDAQERCMIYYDEERSEIASLYRRNVKHYGLSLLQSEEIETICAAMYIEEN